MSAQLIFNLGLLLVVGGLLVWFPDRLTLIPLILSKVQPPESGRFPSGSSPRPRRRPGARRAAPGPKAKKAKKRPKRKKGKKTVA